MKNFPIHYNPAQIEIFDYYVGKHDTIIIEFHAKGSTMEETGDIRTFSQADFSQSLMLHDHFDGDADGIILEHGNGTFHNADVTYLLHEQLIECEMLADFVRDFCALGRLTESEFADLTPNAQRLYMDACEQQTDAPNWQWLLFRHLAGLRPEWHSKYKSIVRYAKANRYQPTRRAAPVSTKELATLAM